MNEQTIQKLSDDQLLLSLASEFESEWKTSHVILLHLKEVRARKLYAARGFGDLFDMLIRHYRVSETSANQRLKALDLMMDVPNVDVALKNGSVNLTTLAMAQRQINREEKITGKKVDQAKKVEIVERISDKTQAQAEVELFQLLPESASAPKTHERRVSKDASRVSLTLPDRVKNKLMRLSEVWAHVNSSLDYVEIIERAADIALAKADPLVRAEKRRDKKIHEETRQDKEGQDKKGTGGKSANATRNRPSVAQDSNIQDARVKAKTEKARRPTYYSVKIDDELWLRSGGQCEFVDDVTGRRCSCRFGPQRDHITPFAMGGSSDFSNLRLLCKTHNLFMARRHFGNEKIEREIRKDHH